MDSSKEDIASSKMHELFMQVLKNRDLSRAGDLFSIPDSIIVNDLTEVLREITTIASQSDYAQNDNDQSVVEICVTRATSCIRETKSVEQHCAALVTLLESCLHHNLQISARGEDPPHAKISSDIISCIFLNYSKKAVMQRALPIAVKFLHKGNRELSRNMASYLSLAAIEYSSLLSPHVQPIMDSIISGNYPLCRVLAQIYEVSPEPLQGHAMSLVSLLPHCDNQEKLALLSVFALIAKDKPTLLEASVPQLCEYLQNGQTAGPTLQVFLHMAVKQPSLLADHVSAMKQTAQRYPSTVCLAAQVIGAVGKISKVRAQDALNFVLEYLPKADHGAQSTLLREAAALCSTYPALFSLFTDKVLAGVRKNTSTSQLNKLTSAMTSNQTSPVTPTTSMATNTNHVTSGGVTIVKVGGTPTLATNGITAVSAVNNGVVPTQQQHGSAQAHGYTRRAKLGDSRSTGRLHTATNTNTHRSMTRLNIPGGSVGGLHKSMIGLSSSQHINAIPPSTATPAAPTPPLSNNVIVTGTNKWGIPKLGLLTNTNSSGGVTVTTISNQTQQRIHRPLSQGPLSLSGTSGGHMNQITINSGVDVAETNGVTVNGATTATPSTGVQVQVVNSSTMQNIAVIPTDGAAVNGSASVGSSSHVNVTGPTSTVTPRRNNTTVTLLNSSTTTAPSVSTQRMSVFEPYPMRDTIQHFCEKHLDKIRTYMDKVSMRIPPPVRCTIEERRQKKSAKLHFVCQARGQHCLYSKTFFTMRTRNPRVWIHLMFIALQAKSQHALSSRDASVTSLKHCWDMLKCENKTFLTLVTSAFPCGKDQESLLNELRHSGFFDVFQLSPPPSSCSVAVTQLANSSSTTATSVGGSMDQLEGGDSGGASLLWGCFLCTHPERAVGFLRGDAQPVIEGQLKEKKGRWRLFRRWRTRYFTLSGAHLSCKGSSGGESIDVNQIRSVKVSRGARNIPKAFEIFTGNQTLILKPKDGKNAEEWVQCLSIVVAHSHAKELPGKSNSLPARGMASSRTAI